MLLTPAQEKIVRVLDKGMATPKQLADMLGLGYTEFKAQSMVLTLAQKGVVDKTKAALILRGTEMIKFLNYDCRPKFKGMRTSGKSRQDFAVIGRLRIY